MPKKCGWKEPKGTIHRAVPIGKGKYKIFHLAPLKKKRRVRGKMRTHKTVGITISRRKGRKFVHLKYIKPRRRGS